MAFCTRVFCRGAVAPSLSELLVHLRQNGQSAMIVGGASSRDLLSLDWTEVALSYEDGADPLTIHCHRAGDSSGAAALRAEVADFVDDLAELPPTPERDRVAAHLQASRFVIVVEFPSSGVSASGYECNGWLMNLFVSQADGLVQCDGIGFYDEDDEIILRLG
jgi:hypothetical protein